ncbi:MAG TPA: CotH kinase family protein [Acidimicrobiia bacterium]|nr:CotH kinase family protein [Acidimicrobiia bacterium]
MKILKTILVTSTAAFLALTLLASPSSAVLAKPDKSDSGSLNLTKPSFSPVTNVEPPYEIDQVVELQANYKAGHVGNVTFYRQDGNTWKALAPAQATNSNGNAYLKYTVESGSQAIFAEDQNDKETNTVTFTGTEPPEPGTATLNNPTDNGLKWTATFNDDLPSGTKTELQAREICTYETNETDPASGAFDPEVKQKNCLGPWRTLATGKQSSSGSTTFTMPHRLEVEHTYRAISGSTESNPIKFAAALATNPYGTDTGLSELHFNTYEEDFPDTRDRYFEGEFSMTASDKSVDIDGNGPISAAKCSAEEPQMKSEIKGRGNWSWTFPKKSFSVKTGDKANLCGLGVGKKWALVANDFDKSLTRNTLASYLGQKFNKTGWAPKSVPVEFYINGSYRGSYSLIERIAIQGSVTNNYDEEPNTYADRVNIDKLEGGQTGSSEITGGYVLEWDYRKDADHNVSLPYGSDSWIGIKEPENDVDREGDPTGDGISQAQINWIDGYLEDADDAVRGSNFTDNTNGWQKYIDKASAVDYYIAMEFMKVFDGNMWTSVYMYKPRGEKIHFGPIWDFDLSAGSFTRSVPNLLNTSGWYLKNNQNTDDQQPLGGKTWFNRLNEDPEFQEAVADRWNQVENSVNVTSLIDQHQSLISQSATANFKKWPHSGRVSPNQLIKSSWSADVSYLRSWASGRKSWLDGVCASGTVC